MYGLHKIGDKKCEGCCCSGADECEEPNCNGLVHQIVVDEIDIGDDWEWVHNYKCDKCSYEQRYYNDEPLGIGFDKSGSRSQ